MRRSLTAFATCLVLAAWVVAAAAQTPALAALPTPEKIDAEVRRASAETHANGLAVAVIENGQVAYEQGYGKRNEQGEPLQTQTVMYGASLTKAVFAYAVL